MASAGAEKEKGDPEVVSVELPAPEGWVKKFTPKQGGTPRRNEVVFISPTGEKIKNRRQLDQYLRSHLGGPPSSSFDWGTGDTPRRSTRISEKVKISPEAEKPARASRSSERVEMLPVVEKTKKASSSGLQKGTKRKKNVKNGDEAEGEAVEGDGPKDGDMDDPEGSKRVKRRKASNVDGDKAEVEGYSAEGNGTEDVAQHKEIVEPSESTEITKESVEESVEPSVECLGAIEHELPDDAKEIVDEKVQQDEGQSEGRGKAEPLEFFEETLNGTEFCPTAVSDSEKVASIAKKDSPKDVDMEEAEEKASCVVEDKSTGKDNENMQENVEQPLERKREIKLEEIDIKGTEHNKSKEAPANDGFHGLIEHKLSDKPKENVQEIEHTERESTDKIQESVVKNVEHPAENSSAIKHESAVIFKETVEETLELHVEIQGEAKQVLADISKENDNMDEAEGAEHGKSKEEAASKGNDSLPGTESAVKTAIEHEPAGIPTEHVGIVELHVENQIDIKHELAANEDGDDKVEHNLEQSEGKATELEPGQQVEDNLVSTEVCPPFCDEVPLTHMVDEVTASGNNNFGQWKEIEESPIDAKAFQHADVSSDKNDGSTSVSIKGTVTLSENGGKEEEVIDSIDDFLHDYDDENMHIQASPSDW